MTLSLHLKKFLLILIMSFLLTLSSKAQSDTSHVKKYLNTNIHSELYKIQFTNRLNSQMPREEIIKIMAEPSVSKIYSLIGGTLLVCKSFQESINQAQLSDTTLEIMKDMITKNKIKCQIFKDLHLKYDKDFKEIVKTKKISPFYYFNYKTDDSEGTSTIGLFDNIKECENFSKMVKKKMNFYSTECRYYKGLE